MNDESKTPEERARAALLDIASRESGDEVSILYLLREDPDALKVARRLIGFRATGSSRQGSEGRRKSQNSQPRYSAVGTGLKRPGDD